MYVYLHAVKLPTAWLLLHLNIAAVTVIILLELNCCFRSDAAVKSREHPGYMSSSVNNYFVLSDD